MHDEELAARELERLTQHEVALVIRVDPQQRRHHVDVAETPKRCQ